jgi:hypothetical protein
LGSAAGAAGAHDHGAPATGTAVRALAASPLGTYVGTARGLLFGRALEGPFVDAGLAGQEVRALAVDAADPRSLWAASSAGPMHSSDGGHSWVRLASGLDRPEQVSAIGYLGATVFASVPSGVFEWTPGPGSWARRWSQPSVVDLAADREAGALYAASATGRVGVLARGAWRALAAPADIQPPHGAAHAGLAGVLPLEGRLYTWSAGGRVSVSPDGGLTWTQLGALLGARPPAQVVGFQGDLWAATADGVYRYRLLRFPPASGAWWLQLLVAAAVAGPLGLALAGLERSAPSPAAAVEGSRPFRGAAEYLADLASR